MAQIVFFDRPVELARRNGTMEVKEEGSRKGRLFPLLQATELVALEGAEPAPSLLALLSRYKIPLHIFARGEYRGSWMPATGVLSGAMVRTQYRFLAHDERKRRLERQMLRAAARLRYQVVRVFAPDRLEFWEERYQEIIRKALLPGADRQATLEAFKEADEDRRAEWCLPEGPVSMIRGLAESLVKGAFARLSLDPWCGILHDRQGPGLSQDLLLLLEPLLVDACPLARGHWSVSRFPVEEYRQWLALPAARDGGFTWSLRSLPRREALVLMRTFLGKGDATPGQNLEIPIHEAA